MVSVDGRVQLDVEGILLCDVMAAWVVYGMIA